MQEINENHMLHGEKLSFSCLGCLEFAQLIM